MPFYVGDWLKDAELSLCSPATRGVWIDLLCAMHECDRSGVLRGTRDQLSRTARCSTVELALALTDLQTTGAADVTERNGVVTVANRRMIRERNSREQTRLRVNRHRVGSGVTEKKHECTLEDDIEVQGKGEGKGGGVEGVIAELKLRIGALYKRGAGDPWGYIEEYALAEVCKRPKAIEEMAALESFAVGNAYFPRSVAALAENWTKVLDQARNGAPKPVNQAVANSEMNRVIERMKTIRGQYSDNQSWDQKDRAEYQQLKDRRDTLKKSLGVKY